MDKKEENIGSVVAAEVILPVKRTENVKTEGLGLYFRGNRNDKIIISEVTQGVEECYRQSNCYYSNCHRCIN